MSFEGMAWCLHLQRFKIARARNSDEDDVAVKLRDGSIFVQETWFTSYMHVCYRTPWGGFGVDFRPVAFGISSQANLP